MSERKLVHIEKIEELLPISGADRIELAKVLGWECVVKRGEFKVGDLCAYHEIDSICPAKPEYEFLKDVKYRIKTRKFKKQISQGLALPLSILPAKNWKIGEDVTDVLGVTHFDPESNLHKDNKPYEPSNKFLKSFYKTKTIQYLLKYSFFRKLLLPKKEKGSWPEFLEHTDEPRLANKPSILQDTDDNFFVTEKLDGQSFGCFYRNRKTGLFKNDLFGVVSRNIWLKTPNNQSVYWKMVKKYNLKNILKEHYKKTGEELSINGEQIGPGIQKNKYELKEHDLFIYNIINNRTKYHYDLNEMKLFCEKNKLKIVPILEHKFRQLPTVAEMELFSRGKSKLNDKVEREGIVVRKIVNGDKIVSYKQISSTFLLKNDE